MHPAVHPYLPKLCIFIYRSCVFPVTDCCVLLFTDYIMHGVTGKKECISNNRNLQINYEFFEYSRLGCRCQGGTLGGVSQKYFKIEGLGRRFVDQFVNGTAYESKVGYTTLTGDIRTQIAKDVSLLTNSAETGVKKVILTVFESPQT